MKCNIAGHGQSGFFISSHLYGVETLHPSIQLYFFFFFFVFLPFLGPLP